MPVQCEGKNTAGRRSGNLCKKHFKAGSQADNEEGGFSTLRKASRFRYEILPKFHVMKQFKNGTCMVLDSRDSFDENKSVALVVSFCRVRCSCTIGLLIFSPFSPQQERQVLCVTPKSVPKGGSSGASKKKHVSET